VSNARTALRHAVRVSVLAVALLGGAVGFAADDNTVISPRGAAGRADAPAAVTGSSLNSMSLVFAAALAGVGGWLYWRNRRAAPLGKDLRSLAVEETRSLGNRQFLVVASYEGKKFLLGVCPGRIEFLSDLQCSGEDAARRSRAEDSR
jgi:flagellar protein FliO/FliZ